jgi:hypothetical protein
MNLEFDEQQQCRLESNFIRSRILNKHRLRIQIPKAISDVSKTLQGVAVLRPEK